MQKERMNALTDGVVAIILTIMVLELKSPTSLDLVGINEIISQLLIYLLSFIYVAIYWNNHHHLFYITKEINGNILWLNFIQLFGVSLIPFATKLVHETHYSNFSSVFYGIILLTCSVGYYLLVNGLKKIESNSELRCALHASYKEYLSIIIYLAGMVFGFYFPRIGIMFYIIPALMWLIPDTRIEKKLNK